MLNIHPSLLPAFKGLDTHERALAAGVKITGCTVHVVRPGHGRAARSSPRRAVPVLDGDYGRTRSAARVLAVEHRLYPHALALFASGGISSLGRANNAVRARPRLTKRKFSFGHRSS